MSALIRQLALVSESKQVKPSDLMKVAAALQKQASRDLDPIWDISATVDAFQALEDVPSDYWPMIVMDDIGYDGAAGIHLDRDNQPYALITASADLDTWSLTASHEALEMLVDPFGNRLKAGDSPKSDQGRVNFLVEVSDPSEAADFGYTVNGILVSDFYTPQFFDPVSGPGVRYSYTGALTEPRQILRGGYLSWQEPVSGHWWQQIWFDGAAPRFRELGPMTSSGSLRSQIDRLTGKETAKAQEGGRERAEAAGLTAAVNRNASAAIASRLREEIATLVGKARAPARGVDKASGIRRAPSVRRPGD